MAGGLSSPASTPDSRSTRAADALARQRFAKLHRARRIWAVSAIHGEADRLSSIHDRLGRAWKAGDRLVYLGNYLGRGAAIRRTVDEILQFRLAVLSQPNAFAFDVAFLRGSQEEMWQKSLQLQFAVSPRDVLQWMLDQGLAATLAAYDCDAQHGLNACREGPSAITRWTGMVRTRLHGCPGHDHFFSALRRAAYTDDGQLLFVHSGVDPSRPLDAQGDQFWWGGKRLLELVQPYAGFRRVIRGFDHQHAGLVTAAYATSLDAGCGFGGELLAVCFAPDGSVIETLKA
jgi:serine/threonine protein phosphatase 1